MRIIIKTKNLESRGDLQAFAEEKIGSIKKFIDVLKEDVPEDIRGNTLAEIFIELEKETVHHKKGKIFSAKAQIKLPGKSIIAGARSDDPMKAIVAVKDELKMEIEKYKFRRIDKNRREQRKAQYETKI